MAKKKNKSVSEPASSASSMPAASPEDGVSEAAALAAPAAQQAGAEDGVAPAAQSRLRRLLPDLVKVLIALAVIGLGAAIWYKPPLIRSSFPYVSCRFEGRQVAGATLYRPLAMPTRYYIELPQKLAGRYAWFAVDRRREVAALTEAPGHRFLGLKAIKRSDSLGLDLEFRKLDNSEWRVSFLADAILFSNAVLAVRLDVKPGQP